MNNFSITGIIIKASEVKTGIKKNGLPFRKKQIIVSRPNGKYEFELSINLWDEKCDLVEVGDTVKVLLTNEIKESEHGNLNNNINGYHIEKI